MQSALYSTQIARAFSADHRNRAEWGFRKEGELWRSAI